MYTHTDESSDEVKGLCPLERNILYHGLHAAVQEVAKGRHAPSRCPPFVRQLAFRDKVQTRHNHVTCKSSHISEGNVNVIGISCMHVSKVQTGVAHNYLPTTALIVSYTNKACHVTCM